ncbi:MAG: DUF507 family protein [Candidatus Binatia bacterium]
MPSLALAKYAERHMRDLEPLCRHVAESLVATLSQKDLVRLRTDKKVATEKVAAALLDNFRQEETLEKDAERLAEEHLRTSQGLDRRKVVQLIKQRLAEERKFAL